MSDMVEVRVSSLSGCVLDWAVASCINGGPEFFEAFGARMLGRRLTTETINGNIKPSIDWNQCRPLIEKYILGMNRTWEKSWCAHSKTHLAIGDTLLIAVCRAIVISKSGETVQVPAELMPKLEN